MCFIKIRRLMSDRVKEQWRNIISDCRHLLPCQKLLRKAEQGPTTTATLLAGADNSTAHPRSSAAAHLLALTTAAKLPSPAWLLASLRQPLLRCVTWSCTALWSLAHPSPPHKPAQCQTSKASIICFGKSVVLF